MNESYPLERASEAYERMISGKARFRVVLTMEKSLWRRLVLPGIDDFAVGAFHVPWLHVRRAIARYFWSMIIVDSLTPYKVGYRWHESPSGRLYRLGKWPSHWYR